MAEKKSNPGKFRAKIEIIGVNPFVYLPARILSLIFKQAGKDKGKIPVRIKIDGYEFIQTLIKYSGEWRLYLNTPMRKAAGKDIGDTAKFEIALDKVKRVIPVHPKLTKSLKENPKAKKIMDSLPASRRLEIIRYISFLKTDESVNRNVAKAVKFLLGKERFIGKGYSMINCKRTNSGDEDFLTLVKELDLDLSIRDGDDRAFYNQFNKLDKIKHVIVAYDSKTPVGCGAIKEYSNDTMEVKRMYVPLNRRSHGIASQVLNELEKWAVELKFDKCILETGKRQPEAIALYKKNGYKIIPNYGQYENIENSVCFEKVLAK